jgi:hypothetical protein
LRGSAPGERRGGRQKGTPNKATAAIKDMIVGALDEVGGKDYLVKLATENSTAFVSLIGKVLPLQLTGDKDSPVVIKLVQFNADDSNTV